MTGADESDPQIVQNVIAVNGFAYGVIGADIHVFGNGLPLYLLANWQPEKPGNPDWLRELPSRMLNARRAVVPFTGRDDELAELRHWRDIGPRLTVRWLHGPGGQGKTRLAARLAAESASAGWKVVAAFHGPDADRPKPGSQDIRLADASGLLMIVDYADRWRMTNLTWLLKNTLLQQPGVATRVLMVARTADSWPAVRGILDAYQAGTSSQHLPALGQGTGERRNMFTAALNSFAAIYQLSNAESIGPPGTLNDSEFGLTLALHMAALVAVDAHATGRAPPCDTGGLSMYLLDREQLHWRRLYADRAAAETAGATYRTPPEVMNQTVFTAAITGTVTHAVGMALLENLRLHNPRQVLKDHKTLYPSVNTDHAIVFEPLYPDRLAEDFLALTLPGHLADYPAQTWAAPTATGLLKRGGGQRTPAAWTPRAITFLASAAHRWPHIGETYLYPLLIRDPQLAVDAGGAALSVIAETASITPAVLEAIEAHLPGGRHIDLDVGIAALAARLAEHRLAASMDPAEHARIYGNLGFRLLNAGLRQQALTATQTSAQIHRQLAAVSRELYLPGLADSLNNQASLLAEVGRWTEAVPLSEEAVRLYGELAKVNRDAYLPGLARSLLNHALRLAEVGRRAEAAPVSEEAVRLYGELAEANRDAYLPELGRSLHNHAARLAEVGRRPEAAEASDEAVRLRRELAEANRATYLPDLAMSLNNRAVILAEVGRRPEAAEASEEAVRLYGELAEANRDAYLPGLSKSLMNHATRLKLAGRWAEAAPVSEEAVRLYRELAEANRDAYLPDLAGSLTNRAAMLAEEGRRAEAAPVSEEAVRLYGELAEANRDAYLPGLAMSLSNHAAVLAEGGRRTKALEASEEAVRSYRELAEANRDAHLPDLARSLNNHARLLVEVGQRPEALTVLDEALLLFNELAQLNQEAYLRDYFRGVVTFSYVLIEDGQPGEAIQFLLRVLQVGEQLPQYAGGGIAADAADLLRRAYADDPSGVEEKIHALTGQDVPEWVTERTSKEELLLDL